MLSELSGDTLPESLQPSLTDIPEVKAEQGQEEAVDGDGQLKEKEASSDQVDVVYSDKEKLEKPSDETEVSFLQPRMH